MSDEPGREPGFSARVPAFYFRFADHPGVILLTIGSPMIFGVFIALMRVQMPQNIDPQEVLRYFSWTWFLFVSLIYSAFVFSGELSKDGPFIFSRRNARSTRDVIASHVAFLVILLCLMQIFCFIVPSLPYWMTDTFRARGAPSSVADIVFMVLAAALVHVERKWLFVERQPDGAAPE
jgi:hypothetical protein